MTTDFRALCAELLSVLENEGYAHWIVPPDRDELCLRARAALAQPEPHGPTDEELLGLDELKADWNSQADAFNSWDELGVEEIIWFAQQQALARWGRPAIEPVPVSERLPEPHMKVIAHYLNDLGNSRTILAEWVPAKSRTDDCLVDDDFAEYDEEADEYYWPEGWYESIENWDDYGAVFVHEGMITHWQPLPPRPHHALPVPQQEADRG